MNINTIINEIITILKTLINEQSQIAIKNDIKFNTILSSLDLVEFCLAIEEKFDITIDSQELEKYNTINKLAEYILQYKTNNCYQN